MQTAVKHLGTNRSAPPHIIYSFTCAGHDSAIVALSVSSQVLPNKLR